MSTALLISPTTGTAAELAIVMDDMGNSQQRDNEVLDLPGPLTLAVLPFAPNSKTIANIGHRLGNDIILHQPMEAESEATDGSFSYRKGLLTHNMTQPEFDAQLRAALAGMPEIVGINNHTGSFLTQHRPSMERLMQHISQRGLFFLDSRTTPNTVALQTARDWNVPAIKRDVFLDHFDNRRAIDRAFKKSIALARKRGHAVLIAHPRPISMVYLAEALENLPADVELVTVGDLLRKLRRQTAIAQLESPTSQHISLAQ